MAPDDGSVPRLPAERGRLAGAALPPELAHLAEARSPKRSATAGSGADLKRVAAVAGQLRRRSPTPAGLAGVRDRALLLVGFAGRLRRSELVVYDREDLRFSADGHRG